MDNHFRKFSWSDNLTSLSTSLVTTPQKPLKSEKLQAITDRQHANQQLIYMQNRVQQLAKAKALAKKEISKAKKQAKLAKLQINEKKNSLAMHLQFLQDKKSFEESQRKRFNQERKTRRKNIKNFERRILKYKQELVGEKKEKSKEWEDMRLSEKFEEIKLKRKKRKVSSESYANALRFRCLSQRTSRERNKEEYVFSIESERKTQTDALCKVADLEVVENQLIEELSKTLEMRNSFIEKLKKVKASY